MSQIKFESIYSGQKVQVVGGWDYSLRFFHLTIFDLSLNINEEVLWCDLDYFDFSELKTTQPLINILKELEIVVPVNFWKEVELKERNVIKVLT